MKIRMKRIWSLILTIVLVITMLPGKAVFAATGLDTELVINGGAESTGIAGWTDDTGQGRWNSSGIYSNWAPPAAGSKFFYLFNPSMDAPLTGTMSQLINLTGTEGSGIFSAIAAGNVGLRFSVSMFQGIKADNEAKVILQELDADGNLIKISQAVNTTSSGTAMGSYQINTQVNPDTRKFQVILSATLTKGSCAQFDQVSLKLVSASTGSAPVFGDDFPAAVETDAGVAYTKNFSISDADPGDIDHLSFSAASTNVNLIPVANISVNGSGSNRTLRIMPAGNLSGEADVTVSVSDGTKSTEKNFHVVVHKVISMDTNLVENGNGTNDMAGWSGNLINIKATGNGFHSTDLSSDMNQNIDISKYSALIDGGLTEFLISAGFQNGIGKITAQFYKDIACTNPVDSPVFINGGTPATQKLIPAGVKGVKITLINTSGNYSDEMLVRNISFKIVNNFPKIAEIGTKKTDLSALTVPVSTYYTTANAVLTATSSDQTVIPNNRISIGGSVFNRSVSFTPLKNGKVTISLTLNDGSKTVTKSFDVTAHEQAKVISVSSVQGYYIAGENLDFTVQFNYPVSGGTDSKLPLTIGALSAFATYQSSTADSITYRYTATNNDSGPVTIGAAIDDTESPITGITEYDVLKEISSGSTSVMVVPAPEVTSTLAEESETYGNKITFTATLNCTEPLTGAIQFKADGNDIGLPVELVKNTASYETSETELQTGITKITAEFIPSGSTYQFTSLSSDFYEVNISRKPLEITPRQTEKTFGESDPLLGFTITGGGLAGSDMLMGDLVREPGEAIGEYEIKQGSITNENNPNYDITFISGVKFTVTLAQAAITPDTGSFDKKTMNQNDLLRTIKWGSATAVTDVKNGETSIGPDNYSVSGNTLTIKKGYLASQTVGTLVLMVEFNQGNAAKLTIDIADTTPPFIPVTGITVKGAGGANSAAVGDSLQIQADISPADASERSVDWSIVSGTGALIDENGVLTASAAGRVIVRATARDGSGVYGETTVNITDKGDTVEIAIAQSPIKSILHAITFGLFFVNTIDVSIFSTDSTVDYYEYQIINGSGDSSTWTRGAYFSINPDFKGRVCARAVYRGGRTSVSAVKALVVDKTKPVITADYDASTASIAVSVSDDGAGVGEITYRVGNGQEQTINLEPSKTQDITTQHNFIISSLPEGQYNVAINAADNSVNTADTITIAVNQMPTVIDAAISPKAGSYDLALQLDVKTNIIWNSTSSVTAVVYTGNSVPLRETADYVVSGSAITIKSSYLQSLNLSTGDSAAFTVSFDAGNPVTFIIDFVENHIPGNNADLRGIKVNGTLLTGFDPDKNDYDMELPYTTTSVTVSAEAADPHALVDITQAVLVPGRAVIIVTAENLIDSKTYNINFTLAAPTPVTHNITVQNNGHGFASSDINSAAAGQTVTLRNTADSGYSFAQWQVINPSGLRIHGNTFTMPDEAVTIMAIFQANNSDSGGNGGGSIEGSQTGTVTTPVTPLEKQPGQPVRAVISVTAKAGENGSYGADIPDQAITDAIAQIQADKGVQGKTLKEISLELTLSAPQGNQVLYTKISEAALKALVDAGIKSLKIIGMPVSVELDQTALRTVKGISNGSVTITAASRQELSEDAKTMIGGRPVYNITVGYTEGGSTLNITNLRGGTATVSIPYLPSPGELVDYLYGVYVDGSGRAIRMDASAYDPNRGCLVITTNHFSVYGVGYTAPSAKFKDIINHWAKGYIDYVTGRGLLSETSKNTFSPNAPMTRGMLVTALAKLSGAVVSGCKGSSFVDVSEGNKYKPYIEWAYKKGIIQEVGNKKFAPNQAVTHEEMAVILKNYAEVTGYTLPVTQEAAAFADKDSILSSCKAAVKAMQQAGIMVGVKNKFNPKSSVTRAESSAILYRYIKLTLNPATAQGWTRNDSGQWMYFKNEKALTGWQTIDGKVYCFNINGGAYSDVWRKNDKGEWFYLSDDGSALADWQDIGTKGSSMRYYFGENYVMASGKWLQIKGKWYYFNMDGTLAKNVIIDGYEVDANGARKMQ